MVILRLEIEAQGGRIDVSISKWSVFSLFDYEHTIEILKDIHYDYIIAKASKEYLIDLGLTQECSLENTSVHVF